MLFEWKEEHSVKIITFDDHHRKLFKMLNDLHDAMTDRKGGEITGNILKSLIDYTKYHFGEEERLMTKYNFDGFKDHKKEHDDFVVKISDMQARFAKNDASVTIELRKFLKDWWIKHIQSTDKKYTEFFKGMGLT